MDIGGQGVDGQLPFNVRFWECNTSIAGPHGDAQLYQR